MTAPVLPRSSTSNTSSGDSLTARLSAEQSSLRARTIAALVLGCVGVIAVVAAVGTFALSEGRWMALPRFTPVAIWLFAAAAIFVARRLYTNDAKRFALSTIAGVVEREQSLRDGSLRGALEVAHTGVFGARAAQDVAKRLTPAQLAPEFARELTKSLLIAAAVAAFGLAVLTGIAKFRGDGFSAVAHPIRAWRGTLLPALAFEKLPPSVPRGMPLTVRMRAEGRNEITVSQRAEGEAWRDTVLSVNEQGVASLALGPVRAPVTLRVNDGRAPAAEAMIKVDERGWIGDVALFAEYPAYLARTNETLEPVSPVRVPRGTRVRVTAVLRGGARDAALSDGAQTVALVDAAAAEKSGEGTRVTGVMSLDHDGTWKWSASATPRATGETLPPELPDSLSFLVVPDKAPEVMIASPQSDTAIGVVGTVPVIIRSADDHAVRHLVLTLWREAANADKNDKTAPKREQIDIGDPASSFFEGGVTVPLDGRGLEPGDRVHLVAIATDDSPWRQQTSSAEVILRVPTLSEQRSMARSLADSLAARALQMAAQEKRMQQNTADAARSRDLKSGGKSDESNGAPKNDGAKSSMSFQAAEKARQMAREQQQMGAKIDSLRQSAKELENRLKSANALDTALAGRMRDIQKMLRDAMTPEMQKQLEALNKSSERLSGTEAQQSMEQLAQQQQQLRQQLDKSAEMLKRAALEGSMSTLRDEAKELADAQRNLADKLQGKPTGKNGEKAGEKGTEKNGTPQNAQQNGEQDPKALAERSRQLKEEVDKLAKRLDEAGAKPGASKTRAAQPMLDKAAEAMDRAAEEAMKEAQQNAQKNDAGEKSEQSAMDKALQALKDEKDKSAMAGQPPKDADSKMSAGEGKQSGQSGEQKQGAQQAGKPGQGQQSGGQQQGQGQPQPGQQGQQGQRGGQQGQQGGQKAGDDARQAGDAMDKAAQQLSAARESQVDAWKTELSEQLDQSINETMQLARQQADLEQRARQGGNAQQMQGEQGALQQGVQQAAERLEKAGRSSSLLSQRSQKAMADAQRRVQQATQQAGQAQQQGGNEQAQNAMKDATEALNQALSSLVRDREKVNNAQSASGFTEMMEQLKQLAQKQGSLNGQMQGLNMLPGGAQGDAAKQQSRVLARQQRDVAKTLTDVSDADQTGRTDALAKEAQMIAQQIERAGIDPSVAARQQQLYRRLLDAGRFLEQDERDDEGPREAKTGLSAGARNVDGPQSGKAANKYAPPAWNDLRGLGPEERRLVIEYFRRLNGSTP